jgi:hypothetical protein
MVIYGGTRAAFSVTHADTGFVVASSTDPEDVDTHLNVERLRFDDVYLALEIHGNAGLAYRLYQAAFNRVPDIGGLGYQMKALDDGGSLPWVASNFIASPEFQATYGLLGDAAFFTPLYANVLHRSPDLGGLACHVDRLERGTAREIILIGFSESPKTRPT